MNKRLLLDLFLTTLLLGAALCVARGVIQSSLPCFFGAWALVLSAILVWLESRSTRHEPAPIDDGARPRTADFQ